MFACWSAAAVWISRSKRLTERPCASSGRQHLDGNLSLEAQLFGFEDAAHPATAKFPVQPVGVTERGLKLRAEIGGQMDLARGRWPAATKFEVEPRAECTGRVDSRPDFRAAGIQLRSVSIFSSCFNWSAFEMGSDPISSIL